MRSVNKRFSLTTIERRLTALSKLWALSGALLLLSLAILSVVSVFGRWLFSQPIPGDYELVQLGCAVAVASFLPYCQVRKAHVIVDFFTQRSSAQSKAFLDASAALLLALCSALLAWRLWLGAISLYHANEQTMILAVPIWYALALLVPSFILLTLCALYSSIAHWRKR